MVKYIVVCCARDEGRTISGLITRVLSQTIKPEAIIVVDDGSTDETGTLLQVFQQYIDQIKVITRKDRGYSALGRKEMAEVYNEGFKVIQAYPWDYVLILGADALLPPDYVERVLEHMRTEDYAIAGGLPSGEIIGKNYCSGTGRMISRSIMQQLQFQFPVNYTWEMAPIVLARTLGLKVGHFKDVPFFQARGHTRKCDYTGWGKGRKELGYGKVRLVGSCLKAILLGRNLRKGIGMAYGYFSYNPIEG